MNKLSSEVQDVDRCVKCGHSGQVDRNGICRVNLNKSRTGLPDRCACKCEFPSPSVSTTWNHNRNCAIWTATTDGAKKPCDCAQVDSVFKGSVSEAEDKNSGEGSKEHRAVSSTESKATSKLSAALDRIELCLETASDERYQSLREWEQLAHKWKDEGDTHGMNFHQGMAAGANWCDIYYRRIGREIKAIRDGQVTNTSVSDGTT